MAAERVLIVDDEKNIVSSLEGILSDEGYEVGIAEDGLDALERIQSDPPDLVLLDIWLPGMDGIEVLKTIKTYHPEIEVLVMSGHGTIDTAVKATKLGAYDFIEKPFSLDQLTQSVENVLKHKKYKTHPNERDYLNKGQLPLCFELMVEVKKFTKNAARSNKPVLLLGEKGSGKEFLAHAIHQQSRKSDRPFIKLNCAVRKMQSIQNHLFAPASGNGKRGARSQRLGEKVVYLSNLESLSKGLQERLAQALKAESSKKNVLGGEFLPVRVLASSTQDLPALAEQGQIHPDLVRAFADSTLRIPPLRDYAASIPVMVKDYFEECTLEGPTPAPEMEEDALQALCRYDWPGNVKELREVLDKIWITGLTLGRITLRDLPENIRKLRIEPGPLDFGSYGSLEEAEQSWEKSFLIHHLRKQGWDLEQTSQALKTDPQSIRNKLVHHGIRLPEQNGDRAPLLQRTLKRSVVLCGSGLHSGIKTGLILQPMPPGSGIIFLDITSGQTIPARLDHVVSTDYSTCLKKGLATVGTIEHIMAVLHMYRITNLLIKIGDEAPVMDGSAKDFCTLIEDGEFEEQDGFYEELVIEKTYSFGATDPGGPSISIEPSDRLRVSYHMEYPEPIGVQEFTYEFTGEESFRKEIAPARTFGFLEDVAQLTKMGFASGGKLDNFILLGDNKVLNTKLRFDNEFVRHKILDILGDFYLLGKPLRGHIKANRSGHTQNIGLLKILKEDLGL